MLKEYKTVTEVVGPLMVVEGVEGVKFDELVEIKLHTGEMRRGKAVSYTHLYVFLSNMRRRA